LAKAKLAVQCARSRHNVVYPSVCPTVRRQPDHRYLKFNITDRQTEYISTAIPRFALKLFSKKQKELK